MSGIRSAPALRRLYEKYRTAATLKTTKNHPVGCIVVKPETEDAASFEAAFGVGLATDRTDAVLKELAETSLNGALGIVHELTIRLRWDRSSKSANVNLWFYLVPSGRKARGWKPPPRSALPAARGVNLTLDLEPAEPTPVPGGYGHIGPSREPEFGGESKTEDEIGFVEFVNEETKEIVRVPDLSDLPLMGELGELARAGKLDDEDSVDALFAKYAHLMDDVFAEDDVSKIGQVFESNAVVLANSAPAIGSVDLSEARPWAEVSTMVVQETLDRIRAYRDQKLTGRLFVLAPSPGTGKSRGMMQAADEEQAVRRRVGYAVHARTQILEARERLEKSGSQVRLIVVEGRHDKNCNYFEQVTVATDAGFSPGSTVCPKCPMYPGFGFSKRNVCGYYGARIDASRDRFMARLQSRAPAIILTTHASAVQGSRIASKRLQGFWEFDTLFIDEDPSEALVQQHDIHENSLTYMNRDSRGQYDGPTVGTLLLRDAMIEARRQRDEAASKGWVNSLGEPDRVHSRDHGSSYAGTDLRLLLESIAHRYGTNGAKVTLASVASGVVDGMTERPEKGGLMNMDAAAVAAKYPNRHLATLFNMLSVELNVVAEARAAGIELEPAYRVHLDLKESDEGELAATISVHEVRGYANSSTNIVIGDAYANVEHYEGLFGRYKRDGKVDVIKHRAIWPVTSTLIRIVTHAGARDVDNPTKFRDHLDTKVRAVLELERGRRAVFYVHKILKPELKTWLASMRDEMELGEYAIEHWGGGRGKDTYRDFDTFIGVTEYISHLGGLLHGANAIAAIASPGNARIAHWNGYSERKGSMSFINAIGSADPYYQAAFHRGVVDETAQGVHRIRPAMQSPSGTQKRAYLFGHRVPLTDELVAATTATAVVDNGKETADLETEALGRGPRFELKDTLALASTREIAGAIATVFQTLGVWSHAFAHALMTVPSWEGLEDAIINAGFFAGHKTICRALLRDTLSEQGTASPDSDTPLVTRVRYPTRTWTGISQRISSTSRLYRAGLALAIEELGVRASGELRPSWMPESVNGRGYKFWGLGEKFEQIMAAYAPGAQEMVPF